MSDEGLIARVGRILCAALALSGLAAVHGQAAVAEPPREQLGLTRAEAERDAVSNSDRLKAIDGLTKAAKDQSKAVYADLYPRLSFDAYYKRLSYVPEVTILNRTLMFGSKDNYAYGPSLTYTLWDTFGTLKAYRGASKLAESRDQDRRSEHQTLLRDTRADYVRVQQGLEELSSVNDSLVLSRSHYEDIQARLRSGAASKLDRVEAERDVLSYKIKFVQAQAGLSDALKNLLARTKTAPPGDLSHPGPPGADGVTLELRLDPIYKSVDDLKALQFTAPDDAHPRLRSQELLAKALQLQAQSVKASRFPTVQVKASSMLEYPAAGPVIEQINQNSVGLFLTMPIFEMGRTLRIASQKQSEADAARSQRDQTRSDLSRDFDKAQTLLVSLRDQQTLAAQDIENSAEAARLYYEQYKAGKAHLIDVQTADNRALESRVNKARIDAQFLNQVDLLRELSGKEIAE